MNFEFFSKNIPKILKEELPSISAQTKMAPNDRVAILNDRNYQDNNPKKAAIMMLFYPKNTVTHLVLIVRNSYPGVHSSQIAFPGGKVENFDANLEETALRETHEEIGIPPYKIKVIRPLTEIYIPPSNFLVYPFLGFSNHELDFTLQKEEVAAIIELPITKFMDDSIIVSKLMNTSYSKNIEVPCFKVDDHYIWGATAMMMSELKEMLKKVF
jgi:8-oxo-dGTP pyrophosphatase MutT (NUDIX family)